MVVLSYKCEDCLRIIKSYEEYVITKKDETICLSCDKKRKLIIENNTIKETKFQKFIRILIKGE